MNLTKEKRKEGPGKPIVPFNTAVLPWLGAKNPKMQSTRV